MDLFQTVFLALLQGLTEFLPISSSAHLILVPVITGWPDQGLAFDVAVHVGTLVAVVAYFRRDFAAMVVDGVRTAASGNAVGQGRLAWLVVLGTIPIGAVGLVVDRFAGESLRSPVVIALATIAFGVLLWVADRRARGDRDERGLSVRDALIIGGSQALALIPGTSRSGITMTAALMLGLDREAAARFSFLLSAPVILLAGGHKALQAWSSGAPTDWGSIVIGTAVAGVCAFGCIHVFLKLVNRIGFTPFVVYRLVLGAVLLVAFV